METDSYVSGRYPRVRMKATWSANWANASGCREEGIEKKGLKPAVVVSGRTAAPKAQVGAMCQIPCTFTTVSAWPPSEKGGETRGDKGRATATVTQRIPSTHACAMHVPRLCTSSCSSCRRPGTASCGSGPCPLGRACPCGPPQSSAAAPLFGFAGHTVFRRCPMPIASRASSLPTESRPEHMARHCHQTQRASRSITRASRAAKPDAEYVE